jgi:hypothetical protein
MPKIVVGPAAFDPVRLAGFGCVTQMCGAVEDTQVRIVQIVGQPAGFDDGVRITVNRGVSLSFVWAGELLLKTLAGSSKIK